MASIRSIAAKTNTSPATVSRALNNHPEVEHGTRQRVLEAAREAGYLPNVARGPESMTVAVMQTSPSGFYEYDAMLVRGLIRSLGDHKLSIVWLDMFRDKMKQESFGQFFHRRGVRGVVLRAFGDSRQIVEQVADAGVKLIAIGEKFDRPEINWVRINARKESQRAVEHLIEMGHKRLAIVTHERPTSDHADRKLGYREALDAAGIAYDEHLVVRSTPSPDAGAAAMNRLLSLPQPPTGVYITDPPTTLGAIYRCHELGIRIPADLSIIGFDDDRVRQTTWPKYSAVLQNTTQLGADAGTWMARHLAGQTQEPLQMEFQASFEVLNSTGRPPPKAIRVLPDGTRT